MGKDLIVPIGVLGILVSMIVPLSPGLLDLLLVANLLGALLLLVSTLAIAEPLKISALPTILLLATLLRLALNVSTTRLILGTGDAGEAVEAFGHIVVQGNIVVGAIVFLVITLIQFIVIAKGSERVAEVSARFTLDALPGKQMSIDADVRAGLIDFETARTKRQELQIESRFYGALDGSMKFIKGDAIAGLIITVVNIIGGLIIGMASKGMSISEAASLYTLLTVGDGLLSQIPALLNALAAGMVVTRVTRGDGAPLARELLSQLGQLRHVKVLVGVVAIGFGCVPGMPSLPFFALAVVFIVGALVGSEAPTSGGESERARFVPRMPPLWQVVLTSRELTARSLGEWCTELEGARQRVYSRTGLILPAPEVTVVEGDDRWRIELRGFTVQRGDADSTDAGPVGAFEVSAERHGVECVDDILTRRTLDFFDAAAPELVAAVVPGIATVTQVTEVLKGLVREGISIRNFDTILQAIAESGARAGGDRALLQEVRVALARVITAKWGSPNGSLEGLTIDAVMDMAFAKIEREQGPLDLRLVERLVTGVQRFDEGGFLPVVTSKLARGVVRDCLRARGLSNPVVAFEEIAPGATFVSRGHIGIDRPEEVEEVLDALAA